VALQLTATFQAALAMFVLLIPVVVKLVSAWLALVAILPESLSEWLSLVLLAMQELLRTKQFVKDSLFVVTKSHV